MLQPTSHVSGRVLVVYVPRHHVPLACSHHELMRLELITSPCSSPTSSAHPYLSLIRMRKPRPTLALYPGEPPMCSGEEDGQQQHHTQSASMTTSGPEDGSFLSPDQTSKLPDRLPPGTHPVITVAGAGAGKDASQVATEQQARIPGGRGPWWKTRAAYFSYAVAAAVLLVLLVVLLVLGLLGYLTKVGGFFHLVPYPFPSPFPFPFLPLTGCCGELLRCIDLLLSC